MYIFTIDFEDWFERKQNAELKPLPLSRLKFGSDEMLAIVEKAGVKPTFFILGCTAERNPSLIAEIADKYDIGIHGYEHYNCNDISVEVFEKDLRKVKRLLKDITGKDVNKYRSPSFSLANRSFLKVLVDNGIEVDCSLASINHQYGSKVLSSNSPCRILVDGAEIKEFPPTTIGFGNFKFGFLGGGYFRMLPYSITRKLTSQNKEYASAYIHPCDLDKKLPWDYAETIQLEERTFFAKLKAQVGLKTSARKLERWLSDFDFVDVETAVKMIDWENTPLEKM
ncbi:MAG: DUF3473 domain-containing protein [Bacteroidales bacterium]|nr:DUF3473 domain-containing protein [Bacteroidales bacterium]MEE1096897.1 DUF3473 domain-containing protein [Bacteroidales bacterium]